MTKKNSGRRRRRNRGRPQASGERVEVVEGQQLFVNSTNGTVVQVPIRPQSFTRCLAIADNFQYYRFTRVQVSIHPTLENAAAGTENNGSMAIGYLPGAAPDTPPANEASVLALPFISYMSNGQTIPSRLVIPRRELLGNSVLKWFKSIVGTPTDQFEIQGILYTFGQWNTTPTLGINFMIKYRCEFQGWSLAGNTPLNYVPKNVSALASFIDSRKEVKEKDGKGGKVLEIEGFKYLRISD